MSPFQTAGFLCLFYSLTLFGRSLGQNGADVVTVSVREDDTAVLPCSISTKENIVAAIFDWVKDSSPSRKEVFLYQSGLHYNNGRPGQDGQFKGRVSHFQDELKNGNASIKIQNTKIEDSGNYTCIFPSTQPRQISYVQLLVDQLLKDRSRERNGTAKPCITVLDETKDWSLLQCEVRGASPELKVEWQDSAGNILGAGKPQVMERDGLYYTTLRTTVTKTGHFYCVVTQEEISHQTRSETYVFINEDSSSKVDIGWLFLALVLQAAVLVVVVVVLIGTKWITITFNKGPYRQRNDVESSTEKPLNSAL